MAHILVNLTLTALSNSYNTLKCFNVCTRVMHNLRLVHYVTLTVIASPECTTLKHADPAKCVITILVLSRDLQPIRTKSMQ